MTRKITHLPLAELKPDPRNPKGHALATIDSSVGRFGFLEPIVLDGRTGLIVSGHGRREVLAAMEERGDAPPDGVTVDGDGRWLVPVTTGWSSRDDTEAAGALIAMNRTTELGGWVDDSLLDLLGTLAAEPAGLDGVGYDTDDIDALRALLDGVGDSAGALQPPEEEGPGPGGTYAVIVECADEAAQQSTYEQLAALGYSCRVVVV